MVALYSPLLALTLLLALPYWLWQMLRSGKYRAGLLERLGRVPPHLARTGDQPCIWLHAVSVGEVLASSGLIEELRRRFPDWRLVVSTTTQTGQALARERFGPENVFYFPLDLGFAIRPYLDALRPRLVVVAETEFWPNFLRLAKQAGARIAIVNARISDRSFPRYRLARGLLRRILAPVDLFLTQSKLDSERLVAIGAGRDKVHFTGNLKFGVLAREDRPIVGRIRAALPPSAPVLVCGSTADGEEAILLTAFREIRTKHPHAVLILAPRHPERFDAVAALVAQYRLPLIRRSQWQDATLAGSVLLLDSIGELASLYALATLAFVGGSLVPRGGHNILEPAQFGKPIYVGPHTANFRDIVGIFRAADAVRVVTAANIVYEWELLLASPQSQHDLGKRAFEVFSSQVGATQRTLEALEVLLWKPSELGTAARRVP
jgi:3-deoxy-D-manno-octulosonic-acid transferase